MLALINRVVNIAKITLVYAILDYIWLVSTVKYELLLILTQLTYTWVLLDMFYNGWLKGKYKDEDRITKMTRIITMTLAGLGILVTMFIPQHILAYCIISGLIGAIYIDHYDLTITMEVKE